MICLDSGRGHGVGSSDLNVTRLKKARVFFKLLTSFVQSKSGGRRDIFQDKNSIKSELIYQKKPVHEVGLRYVSKF